MLFGNQLVVDDFLFEWGADHTYADFVPQGVAAACTFTDELVILLVEYEVVGVNLPQGNHPFDFGGFDLNILKDSLQANW